MRSIACASAVRSWAAEGGKLIAGLPVQAEAPVAFSACAQARSVSSWMVGAGLREKYAQVLSAQKPIKFSRNNHFRSLFVSWVTM